MLIHPLIIAQPGSIAGRRPRMSVRPKVGQMRSDIADIDSARTSRIVVVVHSRAHGPVLGYLHVSAHEDVP